MLTILGLGTNVGNRNAHLQNAVAVLCDVLSDLRCSRIVESAALLPVGAPDSWDMPFWNMAVAGYSAHAPEALLAEIKSLEKTLGRVNRGVWSPREIDIDILAMDDLVFANDVISIPHKALLERDFALLPLAELAPDWRFPLKGEFHQRKAVDIVRHKNYALPYVN